jgi:hypothetical protein
MTAIQQDQIQAFVFNAKEKKPVQLLSHIAATQNLHEITLKKPGSISAIGSSLRSLACKASITP